MTVRVNYAAIEIGNALRKKRELVGLTQLSVADEMRVSDALVCQWEAGKTNILAVQWMQLEAIYERHAKALGVSL